MDDLVFMLESGEAVTFAVGVTPREIAATLSASLARSLTGAVVAGVLRGPDEPLEQGGELRFVVTGISPLVKALLLFSVAKAFLFVPTTGLYRRASGEVLREALVRRVLDDTLTKADAEVRALAERLRSGNLSLPDWQRAMEREVKSAHLAAFTLRQGGWGQLSPSALRRAAGVLYRPGAAPEDWGQYQYLRRFAEDISTGRQRLDGSLSARAALYVQAARATYDAEMRRQARQRGMDEERFVLAVADHCTDADGPYGGCVERAAASWQPIGTFPGIGKVNCRANDRCSVIYRNSETGELWPTT